MFLRCLTSPYLGLEHLNLHLQRLEACHSAPSSGGSLFQAVALQAVALVRYLVPPEVLTGQLGCKEGKRRWAALVSRSQ